MLGQWRVYLSVILKEFRGEESSLCQDCIESRNTMPLAQNKTVPARIFYDFRVDFQEVPVQVYEKFDKRKGATQMRGSGLMGKLYDSSAYSSCDGNL